MTDLGIFDDMDMNQNNMTSSSLSHHSNNHATVDLIFNDDSSSSSPAAIKLISTLSNTSLTLPHHPNDRIVDLDTTTTTNNQQQQQQLVAEPDIVVIPDHYVPIDQIEYLRPYEKINQYALSTVTAHRIYLARSIHTILPMIRKQNTFNACVPKIFALATDLDPLVRTSLATDIPDLFLAYGNGSAVSSVLLSNESLAPGEDPPITTCHGEMVVDDQQLFNWHATNKVFSTITLNSTNISQIPKSPLPTSSSLLPIHLLNVTLLPLLVDPVKRIADLTHASILDALQHPNSNSEEKLGNVLADWALSLLAINLASAQQLIDVANTTTATNVENTMMMESQHHQLNSPTTQFSTYENSIPSQRFIDHSLQYNNTSISNGPSSHQNQITDTILPPSAVVAALKSSTSMSSITITNPVGSSLVHSPKTLFVNCTVNGLDPINTTRSSSSSPITLKVEDLDPSMCSLLFYLLQPINHYSPSHTILDYISSSPIPTTKFGNGGGSDDYQNDNIQSSPSPPQHVHLQQHPSSTNPLPIAKRVDDMHAAILELIAELRPYLSTSQRTQLINVIDTHFVHHASHPVRASAAGALQSCVPTNDTILESQVYPTLVSLASDKSYMTRRRAAEACVCILEHSPGIFQLQIGVPVVISILDDASKNVRDVIYGGLPRIMVAIAYGGTVPGSESDLAMLVSPPDDEDSDTDDLFIDRSPMSMDLRLPLSVLTSEDDTLYMQALAVSPLPTRAMYPYRVPEEFLQTYTLVGMKWKDPDRMAKCAFALPGIMAVFPMKYYQPKFRALMLNLARDPLLELRRPLIAAVDVLARVMPRIYVQEDLVPIVLYWLIHEEDSIKCLLYSKLPGILAQVHDPPSLPIPIIRALMDKLVFNENWHLRRVGARTLASWLQLYLKPGGFAQRALMCTDCSTGPNSEPDHCGSEKDGSGFMETVVPTTTTSSTTLNMQQQILLLPEQSPLPPSPILEDHSCNTKEDKEEDNSMQVDEDDQEQLESSAWALIKEPVLVLLKDPVACVRFSACISIPDLVSLVSLKYQMEMIDHLHQLTESKTFAFRMSAATTISYWVPVLIRDNGSTTTSEVGSRVAPLVVALAQDPVLDVRLQLATVFTCSCVQDLMVVRQLSDGDVMIPVQETGDGALDHRIDDSLVLGLGQAYLILAADPSYSVQQRVLGLAC